MLNFRYIIKCLLPSFLRRQKQEVWLLTITSSLRELYEQFEEFKSRFFFLTGFTGQTIYLEKLLSVTLDRQVKIVTVEPIKSSVIVHKDEGEFADYVTNENDFLILTKEEAENVGSFIVYINDLTPLIALKARKIIQRYVIYNLKFDIKEWTDI